MPYRTVVHAAAWWDLMYGLAFLSGDQTIIIITGPGLLSHTAFVAAVLVACAVCAGAHHVLTTKCFTKFPFDLLCLLDSDASCT